MGLGGVGGAGAAAGSGWLDDAGATSPDAGEMEGAPSPFTAGLTSGPFAEMAATILESTLAASASASASAHASAPPVTNPPPFDPESMPVRSIGGPADDPVVAVLQDALNVARGRRGLPPILVDGDFGGGTQRALQAFQEEAGLERSGVADRGTWRALADAATPLPTGARASETFRAGVPGTTSAESARLEQAWSGTPGTTSITHMSGNGDRPVAVHLPPGFDPDKPARVVTFFHGHGGDIGPKLGDDGVLDRISALGADDPQTVFVVPAARSAPFTYWMKSPESFTALHEQALGEAARLAGAGEITVGERIVDGFSGGGKALKHAINAGELVADKVNLLDAAYGDYAQTVARWAKSHEGAHRPTVESWYTRHAQQAEHNREADAIAPDQFTYHVVGMGHGEVPSSYLGSGR